MKDLYSSINFGLTIFSFFYDDKHRHFDEQFYLEINN